MRVDRRAGHSLTLAAAAAAWACASAPQSSPATSGTTAPVTQPVQQVGPAPRPAVRETVTVRDPELERRIARLELRLLERDAQVDELQARLDTTRTEIVRALGRIQTSASRAEAAAGMAEAELAVQSLRNNSAALPAEVAQAARWVQQGSTEFDGKNYGGALYLANQTKALLAATRARQAGGSSGRAGETPFALPIKLKATGRGNVRAGPGTNFPVAFAIESGGALTGQSYVDEWIRVGDDTGRSGWIHRTLVTRR